MNRSIDIKAKDIKPRTVASIKMTGGFSQIPETFQRLYGWIAHKGYQAIGPSIAVYYNIPGEVPEEQLRWELMSQIPDDTTEMAPGTDGVAVKKLEAVKVASTMYEGPYEKIEPVYIALNTWLANNNYELKGSPEELYYNDPTKPGVVPLTEIRIPIRKKQIH